MKCNLSMIRWYVHRSQRVYRIFVYTLLAFAFIISIYQSILVPSQIGAFVLGMLILSSFVLLSLFIMNLYEKSFCTNPTIYYGSVCGYSHIAGKRVIKVAETDADGNMADSSFVFTCISEGYIARRLSIDTPVVVIKKSGFMNRSTMPYVFPQCNPESFNVKRYKIKKKKRGVNENGEPS